MIDGHTPISIALECGRLVRVDMLLIEPTFLPLDHSAYWGKSLPLLARRPAMAAVECSWQEHGPVHFIIDSGLLDTCQPAQRVLVSALLYSEPISAGEGFSELMLVFMAAWKEFGSVEGMLLEALADVEWNAVAEDRPLHLKVDPGPIRVNLAKGAPSCGQVH